MKEVVLVDIVKNGSDSGLYLDGDLILTADPQAGENVSIVKELSDTLANHFCTTLRHVQHSPNAGWRWFDVRVKLVSDNVIKDPGDLWNRTDVQYCRVVSSINSLDNFLPVVKQISNDMGLELGDLGKLLQRASYHLSNITSP